MGGLDAGSQSSGFRRGATVFRPPYPRSAKPARLVSGTICGGLWFASHVHGPRGAGREERIPLHGAAGGRGAGRTFARTLWIAAEQVDRGPAATSIIAARQGTRAGTSGSNRRIGRIADPAQGAQAGRSQPDGVVAARPWTWWPASQRQPQINQPGPPPYTACFLRSARRLRAQSALFTCRERPTASASAGTASVITDPAAI